MDDLVGVAGRAYTRGRGVAQAGNHLEITGGKSLGDGSNFGLCVDHSQPQTSVEGSFVYFFFVSRVFWSCCANLCVKTRVTPATIFSRVISCAMIMELNSGLVCQSNSRGILVICFGALVPPSGLTIAKFTGRREYMRGAEEHLLLLQSSLLPTVQA